MNVAMFEHLPAGREKWGTPLDDIEEDIGIEENAHARLDAVFLPVVIDPGVVGGFTGSGAGDARESPGPRASASTPASGNAESRSIRGAVGWGLGSLVVDLEHEFQTVCDDILERPTLESSTHLGLAEKVVRQFNSGPHAGILAH